MDNDPSTAFKVRTYGKDELKPGVFRITLPEEMEIEKLRLEGVESGYKPGAAYVSSDFVNWVKAGISQRDGGIEIAANTSDKIQYIKLNHSPYEVAEVKAFNKGQTVDISGASLSNLFPESQENTVKKAWHGDISIDELTPNSTLAVAIEGDYGYNGAFAVIEVNGKIIGAFDRSPTYPFNNWEHTSVKLNGNYTYYFQLPETMINQKMSIYVFGVDKVEEIKQPEVWLTAYPIPFEKKRLVLK
jgi:hypothetical protein